MKARLGARSSFNQNRRKIAIALAASLVLSGCAATQSQPGPNLGYVLNEVQRHPEKRQIGETACQLSITNSSSDFEYEPFFSGFFDIPQSASGTAFCAAIIEAVVAGDLTADDLNDFRSGDDARKKAAVGTLLRKLIEAHERLQGQQVQRPLPVIPGSPG